MADYADTVPTRSRQPAALPHHRCALCARVGAWQPSGRVRISRGAGRPCSQCHCCCRIAAVSRQRNSPISTSAAGVRRYSRLRECLLLRFHQLGFAGPAILFSTSKPGRYVSHRSHPRVPGSFRRDRAHPIVDSACRTTECSVRCCASDRNVILAEGTRPLRSAFARSIALIPAGVIA